MIDGKTKNKLLEELEKNGNVYLSCLKINIHRSTYYRWKGEDKEFNKKAEQAERTGRENNCDIAEHALMLNVKDKKMEAIKYVLGHNSPKYKPKKTSSVTILHKKISDIPITSQKTLEDLLEDDAVNHFAKAMRIKYKYEDMGGIPAKADGTPIEEHEMIDYEAYIKEWYKKKELEKTKTAANVENPALAKNAPATKQL